VKRLGASSDKELSLVQPYPQIAMFSNPTVRSILPSPLPTRVVVLLPLVDGPFVGFPQLRWDSCVTSVEFGRGDVLYYDSGCAQLYNNGAVGGVAIIAVYQKRVDSPTPMGNIEMEERVA
jgi:hypothetical protein